MSIYLDNSATTRVSREAVDAMSRCMTEGYYNPSALYAPALQAEKELKRARQAVARQLDADERGVIFTSGGTESDNLAIWGLLQAMHQPGEVLYTAAEHPAVRNACREAQARFGCAAREIPLTKEGLVDLKALENMLCERVSLLCVMQVCNETGAIMPLAEICALRDRLAPRAAIHVDGVQGFLREPFSFRALGVQTYALSAHKFHGPKGVGALAVRPGTRLKPQTAGGGQQGDLRSGTENTVGVAGLLAAMESFPSQARERMLSLKTLLVGLLRAQLPQTVVLGPADERAAGHILSVAFPPVRAETLLHALEADGIYVGTGSACSSKKGGHSHVLTAMGCAPEVMDGAIRISLCPENTEEEMRLTAQSIARYVALLARFTRR